MENGTQNIHTTWGREKEWKILPCRIETSWREWREERSCGSRECGDLCRLIGHTTVRSIQLWMHGTRRFCKQVAPNWDDDDDLWEIVDDWMRERRNDWRVRLERENNAQITDQDQNRNHGECKNADTHTRENSRCWRSVLLDDTCTHKLRCGTIAWLRWNHWHDGTIFTSETVSESLLVRSRSAGKVLHYVTHSGVCGDWRDNTHKNINSLDLQIETNSCDAKINARC